MDFQTELPSLEAALYRRDYNTSKGLLSSPLPLPSPVSPYSLHNHILQGSYLRYIITKIKQQQIGQFRIAIVQGKRKGRTEGIRLHSKSELTTKSLCNENNEQPGEYMITVSGYNKNNIDTRWELYFPTEDTFNTWYEALKKAKEHNDISDSNGDTDRLKDIVKKMKEKLNIGNRIYRFKIYSNCFEGSKATQFFMNEFNINTSQAINIGTRLVNLSLIHHIGHEHMFIDKKLLYKFTDESIMQINTTNTVVASDLNYEKVVKSLRSMDLIPETENEELFVEALKHCYRDLGLTKIAFNNLQSDSSKILEHQDTYQSFIDDLVTTIRMRCFLYIIIHIMIMIIAKLYQHEDKINIIASIVIILLSIDIFFLQRSAYTNRPALDIDSRARILSIDESEKANIISGDEDDTQEDEYDVGDDDNELGQENESAVNGVRLDPASWPNNPIMIRMSDAMLPSSISESKKIEMSKIIQIHKPGNPEASEIPFESDLFIGKAYIIIDGLADSPHSYFKRKNRKFQFVIQGQFKQRTPFCNVYTGQVLDEPVNQLPAKWLVRTALNLLSKFQPAIKVNLIGNKPYILSPLAAAAQKIIVSKPGDEPSVSKNIYFSTEDMALQGDEFENMDRIRRRAFFSKRSNLANYYYDPELVYTFDLYQHILNLATFRLDLGFIKYDIIKILGLRPVQIMAVNWDISDQNNKSEPEKWPYLYNFEVWHRRSIPPSSIVSPLSRETTPTEKTTSL